MQSLTPQGQNLLNDIAHRYGLSFDSALQMLIAVNRGGGSMAQFSCPELGSGQWMRGGMTMVSDMFNHGLKNTVNNLCAELSNALASTQVFAPVPQGAGGSGNNWWPGDLGLPSSTGAQNNTRYAIFPQARRLVLQRDGQISVFDTLNHQIGGVSQQQGGGSSLSFSSQFGTFTTLDLPLVSGQGLQMHHAGATTPEALQPQPLQPQAPPAPPAPVPTGSGSPEILSLLEKLGQLRDSGVLSEEEFSAKKATLLSRL